MAAFDNANIAVVAYAEVDGATGASTTCNSGIGTTRISQGRYALILPATLGQETPRDLIFVQPKKSTTALAFDGLVKSAVVNDALTLVKNIEIAGVSGSPLVSTAIDHDFTVMILRTQIAPPVGAPA